MIGIIILTHGSLAEAFLETINSIMGEQENVAAISIYPSDDAEQKREELYETINFMDKGKGVIILTDMFGGTPSNLAMSALGVKPIEVIAGINLPMLIKFIENRNFCVLPEAAQKSFDAGRKYIQIASTLLAPR